MMDFLRLFPAAAGQQQSKLLFCAYRQMGFLCWNAAEPSQLALVAAIDDQHQPTTEGATTQNVLFKRVTSISLSPALPRNVDFDHLSVNRSGTFVALVGKRMVFVVEMDAHFWDRRHIPGLDFESSVEHLRPNYFARSDLVHIALFMRKYPPTVLNTLWFDPQEDAKPSFDRTNTPAPNGLLAILFSDNVVRLYDVQSVMDRPFVQLDFNALLSDRTPSSEESGDEFGGGSMEGGYAGGGSRPHSTLGFVTQLVSFDFGPVHLVACHGAQSPKSNKSSPHYLFGSLLAMDSNGEIYMALFPFQQDPLLKSPPPFGPLPCQFPPSAQPPISARLLCAALQLHSIRHSQSQLISLWALASEDGLLVHLALAQRAESPGGFGQNSESSAPPPFELFALECVEIAAGSQHEKGARKSGAGGMSSGSWATAKATMPVQVAKMIRLQNVWTTNNGAPSYLAICARDLYQVDLAPLLTHLAGKCCPTGHQTPQRSPSSSMAQSIVHQLLMFAIEKEKNKPIHVHPAISSVASLELRSSESRVVGQCGEGQKYLLAALCSTFQQGTKSAGVVPILHHFFLATLLKKSSVSVSTLTSPPFSSHRPTPASRHRRQELPPIADEVHRQLAEGNVTLPTIKFDEGEEEENEEKGRELQKLARRVERLSLVQNAIRDNLVTRALPSRQRGIDYTIQRAALLLAGFQAVEHFRENAQQRLTAIFRQITDLKNQIVRRQRQLQALEGRIRKIAQALQPLMFPAPDEEREAIENLHKMKQRMVECQGDIKKLNQHLCEHRHLLLNGGFCPDSIGPAPPSPSPSFSLTSRRTGAAHSSGTLVPAQMFILSRNGRQCSKLREQIHSLLEKQTKRG